MPIFTLRGSRDYRDEALDVARGLFSQSTGGFSTSVVGRRYRHRFRRVNGDGLNGFGSLRVGYLGARLTK